MKSIRKVLAIGILLIGIGTLFGGCAKRYTREDIIKCAQQRLSEKYGEKFQVSEVFNVSDTAYSVYAYSINHPDVIFKASYNKGYSETYNEYESDRYIEALVAKQYKDIAEEQLENFKYDYYLSSEIGRQDREIPLTDTTITIEEYNAVTEENFKRSRIYIYISDAIFKESDEYIYSILKNIVDSAEYYSFSVFFITEADLAMVKEEYETRSELSGSAQTYIDRHYSWVSDWEKHGFLRFKAPALGGIITYEEFEKEMEIIRNDAGY